MAVFRKNKEILRNWLQKPDWAEKNAFPPDLAHSGLMEIINALFACLPQSGPIAQRAAYCIGNCIARLYLEDKEQAQICVRRFIWHMNEESGNIGWGIPEAFGQTLAQSDGLAKIYHNILISYIYDIDGDSNFCDHAPLRVSCYEALYIFGMARPEYREKILTVVHKAKEDDLACLDVMKKILTDF